MDTDGGRWQVVCESHGSILSVDTLKQAHSDAHSDTADFCEECREQTPEQHFPDWRVQYGYGPDNMERPTIVGFPTLRAAVDKAERWLARGVRWDAKVRRYVPSEDGRRVTIIYMGSDSHWQKVGEVIGTKCDGKVITAVWL